MDLTKQELEARRERFTNKMNVVFPEWDTALICSKVNQYYFMGTMQDAILLIRKNGEYKYFVRRSYDRAMEESPLQDAIYQMRSYRDAAAEFGAELGNVYAELDTVPYSMMQRIGKYFNMKSLASLEYVTDTVRAVKSPYELYWIERAGVQQNQFLIEEIPKLLQEGMTEQEFGGKLLDGMIRFGHQGSSRFHIFQTEMIGGQYGFGINSLYPTSFDGPGGMRGAAAATPGVGDPKTKLEKGDMVFVDIGFGMNGYHSDKTQVYCFGEEPREEAVRMQQRCRDIQLAVAEQLKPGAIPSDIYEKTMEGLPVEFLKNFMGYKGHNVRFLGHGVGLYVDELPVITKGFNAPLEENMVIALEPKYAIADVGTVGVEDTFVVTPQGGRCITGDSGNIIVVK